MSNSETKRIRYLLVGGERDGEFVFVESLNEIEPAEAVIRVMPKIEMLSDAGFFNGLAIEPRVAIVPIEYRLQCLRFGSHKAWFYLVADVDMSNWSQEKMREVFNKARSAWGLI